MNSQSIRQLKRDFKKVLNSKIASTVTITFTEKSSSNDLWGNNYTSTTTYSDVKALIEIVSNLNIKRYEYANIQTGKTIFYISLDHNLKDKENIKVIFNEVTYPIRSVVPYQPLGNEFLCQILIQD